MWDSAIKVSIEGLLKADYTEECPKLIRAVLA